MNKTNLLLLLCTTLALTGCDHLARDGNASKFYQSYVGPHTNWPTSSAALVSHHHGVPFYKGYPAQPYIILGSFDRATIPTFRIAKVARVNKADAVLVDTETRLAQAIAVTPLAERAVKRASRTAWLIRFQPVPTASSAKTPRATH